MSQMVDQKTFSIIIQEALEARKSVKGSLDHHRDYPVPKYVVSMCEALLEAIRAAGNTQVTLNEVIRLEGGCTGIDYAHKLALRCSELATK